MTGRIVRRHPHVVVDGTAECSKTGTADRHGLRTCLGRECTACQTTGDDAVRELILPSILRKGNQSKALATSNTQNSLPRYSIPCPKRQLLSARSFWHCSSWLGPSLWHPDGAAVGLATSGVLVLLDSLECRSASVGVISIHLSVLWCDKVYIYARHE